jgi:competence protein ComEC
LIEVLESGYKIEHIVLAKKSAIDEKETDLIDASDRAGVKVLRMEKGDSICSQNMAITCLAPLEKNGVAIGEDGNENSLVLQVE